MSRAKGNDIAAAVVIVVAIAISVVLGLKWMREAGQQASQSPSPAPSASPAKLRTISLSFYNPEKDKDASGNILCSAKGMVVVRRDVPFTNTPIQDAIRQLLVAKPTSEESAKGIISEFPLEGVNLTAASLTNGALTLTFEDPDHRTGGGSCFVSILRAQVEGTAKQFSEVRSVILKPSSLFQP